MEKQFAVAAILAAGAVSGAMAQSPADGAWMVRARAVNLDMANHDGTGLGLAVNNKTMPEIDLTYFFSPNVAVEWVLTVPQKQNVYSNGAFIGTFKHLPPTLLAQYHFTGLQGYKPYVGAGINYTDISHVNLQGGTTLDQDSWGGALQVGVDIPLDRNWSINFDVKKLYIRTRVYAGGVSAGTLKLDPLTAGVGIGYRY